MLVLSRKKNESIVIDDKITIVIVDIRGDKVRLGIDAPKEVSVHRREIFEAIKESEMDNTISVDGPTPKKPSIKKERKPAGERTRAKSPVQKSVPLD